MALLVDVNFIGWLSSEQVKDRLAPLLPGVPIYCAPPTHVLDDVKVIAAAEHVGNYWDYLPNVMLVQKLGAGVDAILSDPKIPVGIRIARLAPAVLGAEIGEYCLTYVLNHQRHVKRYANQQRQLSWCSIEPRSASELTVGVLGLGSIGRRIAQTFVGLGFHVLGWSRSRTQIGGVRNFVGKDALASMLTECDYVLAVLPSTAETRNLINAAMFSHFKPGAVLVNVGRGDLIVDSDLIDALDRQILDSAVLDVFREEPLASDNPLWIHPKIVVTPHVSGWHLDDGFADVAENYRRLLAGEPLLHEVDRRRGY